MDPDPLGKGAKMEISLSCDNEHRTEIQWSFIGPLSLKQEILGAVI
jgi:hypothetical protein